MGRKISEISIIATNTNYSSRKTVGGVGMAYEKPTVGVVVLELPSARLDLLVLRPVIGIDIAIASHAEKQCQEV
jgi:hypothetical protein